MMQGEDQTDFVGNIQCFRISRRGEQRYHIRLNDAQPSVLLAPQVAQIINRAGRRHHAQVDPNLSRHLSNVLPQAEIRPVTRSGNQIDSTSWLKIRGSPIPWNRQEERPPAGASRLWWVCLWWIYFGRVCFGRVCFGQVWLGQVWLGGIISGGQSGEFLRQFLTLVCEFINTTAMSR